MLGAGLALARQVTYGPAVGPDSLVQLSIAENLLAGRGFIQYHGGGVDFWPPLYPLALAAASLVIFTPLAVAGLLNAAIFGLTIFAIGQYLRRRLQSRFMAVWGCVAVALSVPLVDASAWVQTEPLFILMATLALIQTDKFLDEGRTSSLIWAAVCCALTWQTRYIGVAAPLLVGLLLLFQRGTPWPRKGRRVAGFSLIAGLPMALWLLRNYLISGDLPGNRRPVDYYLPDILSDVFNVLSGWACAAECAADMSLAQWLSLGLLLLAAAMVIIAGSVFIREQRGRQSLRQWRPCWIFGGFALIYAGLLVVALMLGHTHHGVDARYLYPLYIPLLVVATVVTDRFLAGARDRKIPLNVGGLPIIKALGRGRVKAPGLMAVALLPILSLWAALQVVPNAVLIHRANSGDLYLGYSAARWADSETLRYIRANPLSGTLYSNEAPLVFMHNAGIANYHSLPESRLAYGNSVYQKYAEYGATPEQLKQWQANVPDGAYVVWFSNSYNINTYDYGDADLRVAPGLEPVAELADGAIYRVNRGYAPPANPYRAAYQAIASGDYGEAAARSDFNIYLNDGSMIYLKEPCYIDDTRKLFSLHLIPADANDLPADRSQFTSDSLGFSFPQHGVFFDDVCLAIAPLPGYEIAQFSTGQYVRGQDHLWLVEQNYVTRSSPYQAAYDAIVSGGYGEPVSRSAFAVYRRGDALVYLREPCVAADAELYFHLHVFPVFRDDLPGDRRERGFVGMDFGLSQRGVRWAGRCLAIVPLPDYPIARIRTGQYVFGGGAVWQAEFADTIYYRAAYDAIAAGGYGKPAARADLDIYRNGGRLAYLKDPCSAADTGARFFLHLYPADAKDLPLERTEYGFNNFIFGSNFPGAAWDGKCVVVVRLPDYPIARLRTGQFVLGSGEWIWQTEFEDTAYYRAAYDAIVAGGYGEPAARAAFDVYRHGGRLAYLKEPCSAADTDARFFLHVYPADAADLPEERGQYGFDNLIFGSKFPGAAWDGKCVAVARLPDYPIARIRTGQFVPGSGERIWQADLR